jgi:peptidoglycan hydrolase-like amidase
MLWRFLAFFLTLTLLLPSSLQAATTGPWSAELKTHTSQGLLTLAPGEVRDLQVSFKNTSTRTWKNDGPGYISLYTHEPKYRLSPFDPGTWLSATQVRRLTEASVAPGALGTLNFQIRAPQTPGLYTETFWLASEGNAWLTGGRVQFKITVQAPAASAPATPAPAPTLEVVTQSAKSMTVKAGKPALLQVALKNTGSTPWAQVSLGQPHTAFKDRSWTDSAVATAESVAPGSRAELTAILLAPSVKGTHRAVLPILIDGQPTGQFISLDLIVKEGERGAIIRDELPAVDVVTYLPTPTIRVGVLIVDEETQNEVLISSAESVIEVRTASGTLVDTLALNQAGRAAYAGGQYEYGAGSTKKTFQEPLRFIPLTPNAILKINNFDRRLTRGTQFANNTFRGTLELRYNTKKLRTWLINEVSIEEYLKGLAEAGNSHPVEFQKALNIAARSYAYFQMKNGGSYRLEGFDVDAYRDQVYWGAEHASRQPKIAEAVEATRGQIVTYQGAVAITSYFSSSDGYTRNWSDVWFGNRPYAKAVPVPCDQGRRLNGHGVGMSLSGAICLANNGTLAPDILKYFYTGITIEKIWE